MGAGLVLRSKHQETQGWRAGCDYAHPSCAHFRSI